MIEENVKEIAQLVEKIKGQGQIEEIVTQEFLQGAIDLYLEHIRQNKPSWYGPYQVIGEVVADLYKIVENLHKMHGGDHL